MLCLETTYGPEYRFKFHYENVNETYMLVIVCVDDERTHMEACEFSSN